MTWELLSLEDGLGAHKAQWDALNARLYANHPLFSSRFVDPLLRYFGGGKDVLCVQLAPANELAGMVILTPAGKGRWSTFLPDQAQLSPVMLQDPRGLAELFRPLPGMPWTIEVLCQDPLFTCVPDADAESTMRHQDHALTMSIALDGTFQDYWEQRPKKLVQNMRRYRKRALEDKGPCRMETIESPAAMRDAVARYAGLESSGWKGAEGTALGADNQQGRFFLEVMQAFAQDGHATVYEYFIGDRLAASRLMIRSEQMLVALKTTYDESLSPFAPGRLLLQDLLSFEFESKRAQSIEFYTNATPDQLAWSTASRSIRHTNIFRNRVVGAAYSALKRYRSRKT